MYTLNFNPPLYFRLFYTKKDPSEKYPMGFFNFKKIFHQNVHTMYALNRKNQPSSYIFIITADRGGIVNVSTSVSVCATLLSNTTSTFLGSFTCTPCVL